MNGGVFWVDMFKPKMVFSVNSVPLCEMVFIIGFLRELRGFA
jgi:hypothetical protein